MLLEFLMRVPERLYELDKYFWQKVIRMSSYYTCNARGTLYPWSYQAQVMELSISFRHAIFQSLPIM